MSPKLLPERCAVNQANPTADLIGDPITDWAAVRFSMAGSARQPPAHLQQPPLPAGPVAHSVPGADLVSMYACNPAVARCMQFEFFQRSKLLV
jgi:hypothetical protein